MYIIGILNPIGHNIALADFTDLDPNHPNYEAIKFLEEHDILNGYADGTFRPDNAVNRAEFLKIIIEGSAIPIGIDEPTPFPDVDHTAWYGQYVKKAYAEGWINGYVDGTFKPEQTINEVEALKILAKAQSWNVDTSILGVPWYEPYLIYASNQGYIDKESTEEDPGNLMSRASISDVIFRTMALETPIEKDTTENPQSPEETEVANEESSTNKTDEPAKEIVIENEKTVVEEKDIIFSPINFNTISTTFFENILLEEEIPNNLYKNEIYTIKGDITAGNYDTATVILDNTSRSSKFTFIGDVKNNHFEIPIYLTSTGNYNIGLIPGDSGQSKAEEISVIKDLPETPTIGSPPKTPDPISISYANDLSKVQFNSSASTLKKIHFKQGTKEFIYISRQYGDTLPIQYKDFQYFNEGEVSFFVEIATLATSRPLVISSPFTVSSSKTFDATEHTFSTIESKAITVTPPDRINTVGKFSITGTLKTDVRTEAYVIKPDGFVEAIQLTTTGTTDTYFNNPIIKSDSNFTYSYTPEKEGRYIVEINNKGGEPILNHPIYIGNEIPLIPDFFDLNTPTLFSETLNVDEARQDLLNLINSSRKEQGLNKITLSEEINIIAQAHADDMAENNFFSHYNLSNQTPDDRRIAARIKTPVGENLAKDSSVISAHYGLMRSASHRENILTKDWTRAGLGIAEKDGYLLIAEEFSTDELTSTNIDDLKNSLFTEINKKRSETSVQTLISNSQLDNASKELNTITINENRSLTNPDFTAALNNNSITGSSELIGRTSTAWETIYKSLLEEPNLLNSIWQAIGIDVQTDSIGKIHTIVIINK